MEFRDDKINYLLNNQNAEPNTIGVWQDLLENKI